MRRERRSRRREYIPEDAYFSRVCAGLFRGFTFARFVDGFFFFFFFFVGGGVWRIVME